MNFCVKCAVLDVEQVVEDYYIRLGLVPWHIFADERIENGQQQRPYEPYRQMGLSTHDMLECIALAETRGISSILSVFTVQKNLRKMLTNLGLSHVAVCDRASAFTAPAVNYYDHYHREATDALT
jgi:hypothetical protein